MNCVHVLFREFFIRFQGKILNNRGIYSSLLSTSFPMLSKPKLVLHVRKMSIRHKNSIHLFGIYTAFYKALWHDLLKTISIEVTTQIVEKMNLPTFLLGFKCPTILSPDKEANGALAHTLQHWLKCLTSEVFLYLL